MRTPNAFIFCVLAFMALLGPMVLGAGPSIRVVVYSGANNHDWRRTTAEIERILGRCAVFDVETTEQPEQMTAERLGEYDVIVSNWNNFGQSGLDWSEGCREAFLAFVRQGKGHVMVHAGGSSFSDWQAYHKVAAGWGAQTGHGSLHEFVVKPTGRAHAITQGVEAFGTRDELWHNTWFPAESRVLMSAFSSKAQGGSGRDEPVLAVNRFGEGRCVNLLLGHDVTAMRNHGFDMVLLRSVEWAARGCVAGTAKIEHEAAGARYFQKTDSSVALIGDGRTLWRFNYAAEQTKPYFHPVALADGTVLTWERPGDHPWHYGLWFSWKHINGVNYWEEDRKTGQVAGVTEWEPVRVQTHADGSAELELDVSYHEPDKANVLTEKRRIVVCAPDESGSYSMDWTSRFTAAAEVELNRTPLPGEEGGSSWGGYAGLSFRACKGVKEAVFTSATGPVALRGGKYRGRDVACEYSGVLAGKAFGVAILDHPDNLNASTPWYLIHDERMDFFSPAVICYGPHRMVQGETFTLRYRLIVHGGRWDAGGLREAYERFAGGETGKK